MDDIEKIQQKIMENNKENFKQIEDTLYNNLVLDPVKGRLPESLFVERFLPFFSGKIKADENNNIISEWISVAGSPMAEVDIIDNSTGNTLYTTPPLLGTDLINVYKKQNKSLANMFNHYEHIGYNSPAEANVFITSEYNKISKDLAIVDSDERKKVFDRWDNIVSRYETTSKETKDTITKKIEQDTSDKDDIVYD